MLILFYSILYEYLVINLCMVMSALRLKLISLWETLDAALHKITQNL
ncbi:hypothetical protein NIES4075_32140 [Tolypothrix sp. NIES-4075]|nr:hypothetical protein NIES4075_32140 [Tolypothrix sp. NIES-4075]